MLFKNFFFSVKRLIIKGGFVTNVLTLTTGTTFAQGLTIAAAPILTRLYMPEDFGIFALFISVSSIFSVVACWSYELAITLPKEEDEAVNLLSLAMLIALGMSGFVLLLVAVGHKPIAKLLGASEQEWWLWWVPVSVLIYGLNQSFIYRIIRKKHFKTLAISEVANSSTSIGTKIGLGVTTSMGAGGLVGGQIVGQVAASTVLGGQIWREDWGMLKGRVNNKKMMKLASKYRKFPLLTSWPTFIDTLTKSLPVIFLSHFFSTKIAGYFALGNRVISLPANLIGQSILQVLYQRLSENRNNQQMTARIVEIAFIYLVRVIILPLVILLFFSPIIFAFVFGSEWKESGIFVQILSTAFAIQFVAGPLSMVFLSAEKQELLAKWKILSFIVTTISLSIGGVMLDYRMCMALLCISNIFLYTLYIYLIFRVSNVSFAKAVVGVFSFKKYPIIYYSDSHSSI